MESAMSRITGTEKTRLRKIIEVDFYDSQVYMKVYMVNKEAQVVNS